MGFVINILYVILVYVLGGVGIELLHDKAAFKYSEGPFSNSSED